MGDGRSYVTGYFSLTLDGIDCGMVQLVEGGDAAAAAVAEPAAHDYYVKKHIGNVKYEDFTMQMAMPLAKPVQDWIEASLSMNYQRKSGELKAADFKREASPSREFSGAALTEIGFPACDATAKDPATMSLKFSPEVVRDKPGDATAAEAPANVKQKALSTSHFRLEIGGIAAAAKVTHIDAMTIARVPGKLDFPNLKITLAAADAAGFTQWHEDFVINGNNDESKHKTGSLTYLDQTRAKELATLRFRGLGIKAVTPAPPKDAVARVTVEMYCENITAKFA